MPPEHATSASPPRLSPWCYTVGWIAALPSELAAATALLDEHHDLPSAVIGDTNSYTVGRMGEHDVVIACLPEGRMGNNAAAVVATQMKRSFPGLRFGLMVGIGGGVPSSVERHDLRLGDVVVSSQNAQNGGVVQYDFGKTIEGGKFIQTGFLNSPPTVLASAVGKIRAQERVSGSKICGHLQRFASMSKPIVRPEDATDLLFNADYEHLHSGSDCSSCDKTQLFVGRGKREDGAKVKIHYGSIASGNQVMRNGQVRDRIAAECGGILCFEMEAAGLMNDFPCIVVRGICDYADTHKNKLWQDFAAGTAAAYAYELLRNILIEELPSSIGILRPNTPMLNHWSEDRIRIPAYYPVQRFMVEENRYWQEYWHTVRRPDLQLPEGVNAGYLRRAPAETVQYGLVVTSPTQDEVQKLNNSMSQASTDQLEVNLANLMSNYHDILISGISLYPNAQDQQLVFAAMKRMTAGSIDKDGVTMRTLLHYLAMNGAPEAVLVHLVNGGFEVNLGDSDSRTPLHLAVICNQADAVETLVERCHADPHARDINRALPWHLALHIDSGNGVENEQRNLSAKRILRFLAKHTNPEEVVSIGPKAVLKRMKEDPEIPIDVIDLTREQWLRDSRLKEFVTTNGGVRSHMIPRSDQLLSNPQVGFYWSPSADGGNSDNEDGRDTGLPRVQKNASIQKSDQQVNPKNISEKDPQEETRLSKYNYGVEERAHELPREPSVENTTTPEDSQGSWNLNPVETPPHAYPRSRKRRLEET